MNPIADPFHQRDEMMIASLQSILLSDERIRIQNLEHRVESRHDEHEVELDALKEWIRGLLIQQERLQKMLGKSQEQLIDLQTEVAILRHRSKRDDSGLIARLKAIMSATITETIEDSREEMAEAMAPLMGDSIRVQIRESRENIVEAIAPVMGDSIRAQIRDSREDIVEAIAPVMGDSIRAQIRDSREDIVEAIAPVMGESIRAQIRQSRQDMIEALYPIIGETVQRAIREFASDLQRNIDQKIRGGFGPKSIFRFIAANLWGVSPSELTLRNALPFSISELFLIQRDSGLLLAHHHPGRLEVSDSDLISGMLTAIRDLARDSFAKDGRYEELEEIQYGEQRIILQNGPAVYLAVVIEGIEPTGFRANVHTLVSELHIRYEQVFNQYDGDPADLPPLKSKLAAFVVETMEEVHRQNGIAPRSRWSLARVGFALLLLIAVLCVSFPIASRLMPVSSASSMPTATSTIAELVVEENLTPSVVPTVMTSSQVVFVSKPTKTITNPTAEPLPERTATLTQLPKPTETIETIELTATPVVRAITSGDIWVRSAPDLAAERIIVLLRDTPVTVLSDQEEWVEIRWLWQKEWQKGWVPKQWLDVSIWPTPLPKLYQQQ